MIQLSLESGWNDDTPPVTTDAQHALPQAEGDLRAGAADLLTTVEAASLLGVHPDYLRRLKRKGKITSIGRLANTRYLRADVETLRQERPAIPIADQVDDSTDLVTPAEAAALLGTSTSEVGRFKREGKISPVMVDRRRPRYHRAEILELREQRSTLPPRNPPQPILERRCPLCRQPFTDWASERRIYCSDPCKHTSQLNRYAPKSAHGIFVRDEWVKSGEYMSTFAKRYSLSVSAIRSALEDRPLADSTIAKFRAVHGDRFPPTVSMNEIRREQKRELVAQNLAKGLGSLPRAHAPETTAKRAQALRERAKREREILARDDPDDPERLEILERRNSIVAKMRQTWATSAAQKARVQRLVERNRSLEGRATVSLTRRLRQNPQPDKATQEQWADEAGPRFELRTAAVLRLWRPTLRGRGLLKGAGGRPRKDDRCAVLQRLMQDTGWYGEGRAPHRFDVTLGDQIGEDYHVAQVWRDRHLKDCVACSGFAKEIKKGQQEIA